MRPLRTLIVAGLVILASGWSAAITLTVSIHKISDNSADATITWPAVALPAPWVLANHYIQLDFNMTNPQDGIQIYTDNTAGDANPQYTGVISPITQTPAGLVNAALRSQKLPTAWRISDALIVSPGPLAADPNLGGDGFLWLYHEDKAQVANNQGAATFVNGDPYVTVQNANCLDPNFLSPCIHYAQGPSQFGVAHSPNYIYLEADFRQALPGSTYRTSTLRVEAFTQ